MGHCFSNESGGKCLLDYLPFSLVSKSSNNTDNSDVKIMSLKFCEVQEVKVLLLSRLPAGAFQ